MRTVTHDLHVHRFGPAGPIQVLAIHGLTGHGRRWRALSEQHLPEFAVAAPDLIGHGRSSWSAPWTMDANVAALATLVENDADGPVVVVGHSFGGAIALHLAATCPDLVSGVALLDPAIGLDGQWMREIADSMLASPTTPTATRRAPKSSAARGPTWTRPNSMRISTNISSHYPTAVTAGGSAYRR